MKGTIYEGWVLAETGQDYVMEIKKTPKIAETIKQKYDFSFEDVKNARGWDEVVRTYIARLCVSQDSDSRPNSVTEYYNKGSCLFKVKNINIPTLVIHSKDDPIVSYGVVPVSTCVDNENIILALT